MDGMQEKLRRVERITTEEEPVTQKQATLLLLDLFAGMYEDFAPHILQVPLNKQDIEVLKTRVKIGIGFTALTAILVVVAAIFMGV